MKDYQVYCVQCPGHTSLYTINPNTIDEFWVDHPGDAPGAEKAKNFLINRKARLEQLGVMETVSNEQYDLKKFLLSSEKFNQWVHDWLKPMWEMRHQPFESDLRSHGLDAEEVSPKTLLDLIEDPRTRESADFVQWKGKVLPPNWCECFYSEGETDSNMVNEFLSEVNFKS